MRNGATVRSWDGWDGWDGWDRVSAQLEEGYRRLTTAVLSHSDALKAGHPWRKSYLNTPFSGDVVFQLQGTEWEEGAEVQAQFSCRCNKQMDFEGRLQGYRHEDHEDEHVLSFCVQWGNGDEIVALGPEFVSRRLPEAEYEARVREFIGRSLDLALANVDVIARALLGGNSP